MNLPFIPDLNLPQCLNLIKIQFHDPIGRFPRDFRSTFVSCGCPSCACPSLSGSWEWPGLCAQGTSLHPRGLGIITESSLVLVQVFFLVASWEKGKVATFIQFSCLIDHFLFLKKEFFKFGSNFPSELLKFCCVVFNFQICIMN